MAMTDLEQTAMERLRLASQMSLKLYKQPLLLTDSGGKDSAVICKLAENAGIPFEICHSHTTADAPETVYHVRKRAKEYEEKGVEYTIILPTYQGKRTSMWDLIPKKLMPPTRVVRYCCAVLKETAGKGRFVVTGVRWAESVKRAANRGALEVQAADPKKKLILNNDNEEDRQLFENCQMKGKRVCNPIIDWTDRDVWDYLTDQKVETNPLYNEGFCRVGCVGCPMAGKCRKMEFVMYPKLGKPVTQSLPDGRVFSAITSERLTGCLKHEKPAGRPMTRAGERPAKMSFTGGWRTAFFRVKQTYGRITKMRLIDADALLAEYDRQHEGEPGKARKLIEDAPTVAAVPASKILALRDALYESDAVTMRGLRNLNMLIAKYEGGQDHAVD